MSHRRIARGTGWPRPADFPAPPEPADRRRWAEADRAARPARLARLRTVLADAGIDGYFGLRPEDARYLTGVRLGFGEEKVAGHSGRFLVTETAVVVLADSRYTAQFAAEADGARLEVLSGELVDRWRPLLAELGIRRLAVDRSCPVGLWRELEAAAPTVELEVAPDWLDELRATKEPAEVERIRAAAAVADRALASLLPEIAPGRTERELALRLEWAIRTGGADGLAFEVACLSGAQAALPHGSPRPVPIERGTVLLVDFGAEVDGYRSDMTRTLFVGEPGPAATAIYELVARAQAAAVDRLAASLAEPTPPSGRAVDAAARAVIAAAGFGPSFGHGTGHGIGLATHERPRLSRFAPDTPLPSPTVFSVEPGVYLEGDLGVRIEDLVAYDHGARRLERLTGFPSDPVVVGEPDRRRPQRWRR